MDRRDSSEFLAGLDDATVAALSNAEKLLEGMGDGFRQEARRQIDSLKEAVSAYGAGGSAADVDGGSLCRAAFEASHELRGQAGTFGYGLLTEICDSLCTVLELFMKEDADTRRRSPRGQKLWTAIVHHAEAVSTIVDADLKGDGGDVGRQLSAELERLRNHLTGQAA